MTLLLAMGSIDVSIGILMGLAAIAVAHALLASVDPALALLVGPIAGGALGLVTAAVVVLGRVPAIVGTLGLLGVYRMGVFALLGGQWLSGLPDGLTLMLSVTIAGVPISALVLGFAYLVVWWRCGGRPMVRISSRSAIPRRRRGFPACRCAACGSPPSSPAGR